MKKLIFTIIAMLIVGGFRAPQALAMPDSSVIAADCVAAQSVMSQIEKADAVTRINLGYIYNNTLNLMFAMNARLSANKIAAPNLVAVTSNFDSGFTTFRNNYDHYDDDLIAAISVDCAKNPLGFYNQLGVARAARAALANDTNNLKQFITNYQNELDQITNSIGSTK